MPTCWRKRDATRRSRAPASRSRHGGLRRHGNRFVSSARPTQAIRILVPPNLRRRNGLLTLLAALIWFEPRWKLRFQSAWFDTYQMLKPREIASTPVTVVEIDERSLARWVSGHGRGRYSPNGTRHRARAASRDRDRHRDARTGPAVAGAPARDARGSAIRSLRAVWTRSPPAIASLEARSRQGRSCSGSRAFLSGPTSEAACSAVRAHRSREIRSFIDGGRVERAAYAGALTNVDELDRVPRATA